MSESDFPTAILTSKSPEDVANFVSHALGLSSKLIEKNLLPWFSNYANALHRYNTELSELVAGGREFFTDSDDEFGSLNKIWNCVASSIMSQIQVNQAILKTVSGDVLRPFHDAFNKDFKYPELVLNAEELLELKDAVSTENGAYQWNAKAPAILLNLENYKRYEKELLFNAFIAYLNTATSKTANMVNKNENAVNFILREHQLKKEMENYTAHVINTKAPPAAPPASAANVTQKQPPARRDTSRSSVVTSSTETSKKEKRKSKLRSRVGSILGRKKKPAANSKSAETIPEDESLHSHQETFATDNRSSLYNAPPPPQLPRRDSALSQSKVATPKEEPSQKASQLPLFDAKPLEPTVVPAPESKTVTSAKEIKDDANFVKYESSDESDVPTDPNGNRLSLLSAHNLGQPPKLDNESDTRSRNTFSSKYSFEYGDESKSISTPKQAARAPGSARIPNGDANTHSVPSATIKNFSEKKSIPENSNSVIPPIRQAPPPPPPTRKAHSDRDSQLFSSAQMHAAVNRRDSYIGETSLVSQTTGNSMLAQDHFKHFGASEEAIHEGLNISIAEIINVTFHDGIVSKSQVLGEVAFNYNSQHAMEHFDIRIPTKFSKSLLNDQLITSGGDDSYRININQVEGRTLGGIKYLMDVAPENVPLLLKQVWKFEQHQASLIIKVSLNPEFGESLSLQNLMISASLDKSVESTLASSKPEGSFNKDMNRITWRYTQPVAFDSEQPELKFIARIMTKGVAKEAPSGVKVKFTTSNATSFIQIHDLEGSSVPSIRSLSSGVYGSHSA